VLSRVEHAYQDGREIYTATGPEPVFADRY
jgi:hypothetical protein